MNRFLLKAVLFVVVVFIILLGVSFLPLNPHSYNAEFSAKQKRLSDKTEPAIVFVGGSNVGFGIDSSVIKDALKFPVLNDGLHAGSGVYFILETTCPKLQRGDIAVLLFEYQHFYGESNGSETTSSHFLYQKNVFENLSFRSVKNVLINYPELIPHQVYGACRFLFRGNWRIPKKPYSKESFNEYGDVVGHLDLPNKKIRPSGPTGVLDFEAVSFFSKKIKEMRERGVHVVVLPPVFQKSSFEKWKEQINVLRNALKNQGVDFDANPERYVLDDCCFFDTCYHLNKKGREIRTQILLEDLSERMTREGIIQAPADE